GRSKEKETHIGNAGICNGNDDPGVTADEARIRGSQRDEAEDTRAHQQRREVPNCFGDLVVLASPFGCVKSGTRFVRRPKRFSRKSKRAVNQVPEPRKI